MANLLEGRTALILGVANKWSIAYAIAKAFKREGAKILLTYQGERLKSAAEELGAELGASLIFSCDVTKDEDLVTLAETVKGQGRLDVIVHSIAFANREDLSNAFVETSREGYRVAQDVSAYSLVAVSRVLHPLMTDGGSIMALSYYGAVKVVPNYNVMGVAKAALEACVRYLTVDLGPKNIRVNAISAGPIKTASARGISGFSKILDYFAEHAPMRKQTDPAEVADTAVFLASDLGRGVTGNVIYVDAGFQVMGLLQH